MTVLTLPGGYGSFLYENWSTIQGHLGFKSDAQK